MYYSGYRYGKSLIPVSAEDEDAMKLSNDKCLSLLGFTSMDNVRLYCTCMYTCTVHVDAHVCTCNS